jgi:hypothetical protein
MKTTKRNFWLDVIIFMHLLITTITGFLLWLAIPHQLESVFLGFSRSIWVSAHICFGVVGLAGIALHIAWHWDWLKAMRGRPFSEMPKKLRANRVVDRIMWITFIATNVFGLIAWVLHYSDQVYLVRMPDRLHVVFGVEWTILAIAHLVLHWKWIASTAQRCIHVNVGVSGDLQKSKTYDQGSRQRGIENDPVEATETTVKYEC